MRFVTDSSSDDEMNYDSHSNDNSFLVRNTIAYKIQSFMHPCTVYTKCSFYTQESKSK